ncbi:MAG: hypothetical protein ACYTGB_18560, partial [Planctomycetota bacterium]
MNLLTLLALGAPAPTPQRSQFGQIAWVAGIFALIIVGIILLFLVIKYGGLWIKAAVSNAHVSLLSL